jgi:hypothetical protein
LTEIFARLLGFIVFGPSYKINSLVPAAAGEPSGRSGSSGASFPPPQAESSKLTATASMAMFFFFITATPLMRYGIYFPQIRIISYADSVDNPPPNVLYGVRRGKQHPFS